MNRAHGSLVILAISQDGHNRIWRSNVWGLSDKLIVNTNINYIGESEVHFLFSFIFAFIFSFQTFSNRVIIEMRL